MAIAAGNLSTEILILKPISVCDVETDPFKKFRSPQPFLAGFFTGDRFRTFWDEASITVKYRGKTIRTRQCTWDCWRAMRKELVGHYIYWHNGGKFDARFFMPFLKADGFRLRPIKGRMARFSHKDGTEFLDSYCLLPVSLKATGEKLDIDYRKMEKCRREKHKEEIIKYWKQDLVALFDKVSEFIAQYGFGMTMAGRTFAQLKEQFGINPPKTDEHFDNNFRRFYYGGRVEFFRLGQLPGRYKVIDINSAYPNAMTRKHAFGLEFRATEKLPKSDAVLQTCFIRFTGASAGGLPFRMEDKSLSFGPHEGEFFVTGWEFVAARKLGKVFVREVIECLEPTEVCDFVKFVDYFYRQKREAVKGSSEELFAKLFLNSAYGRFALNPREFKDVLMTDIKEEPDENAQYRKQIRKIVEKKHPGIRGKALAELCADYWDGFDGKWSLANEFEDIGCAIWERPCEIRSNSFFNVATAASITGCVRAYMMESLAQVTDPVYCDTDSIICTDTGKLPLGRELGEWKLEAESEEGGMYIAGKKLYAMRLTEPYWKKKDKWSKDDRKWKIASKGVRLSPSEIVTVASGVEVKSTLEAPTFSLYSTRSIRGSAADFVTRTVRRDDLRKRRNFPKTVLTAV